MGRYVSFARRIRELRKGRGLTQHDLSRASGLSRSYISRLEMGDIALPSRDKFRSLAAALNTSQEDLLLAAGFLDTRAPGDELPDLRTYLRRKYAIHDSMVLQAIETIIERVPKK